MTHLDLSEHWPTYVVVMIGILYILSLTVERYIGYGSVHCRSLYERTTAQSHKKP
jgi:hypothetical protein